ncbi:MAG: AraC family transcriptional regulator [Bacillota bacterium]
MELNSSSKVQANFNIKLASQCANAFFIASGLGCCVSDCEGTRYAEFGYCCSSCKLCELYGTAPRERMESEVYGAISAERFGGKYVYFCPGGLTFFVSPIFDTRGVAAKITVGPFLMVEREDYAAFELTEMVQLDQLRREQAKKAIDDIPYMTADKVEALSTMLFLAVGFINDVSGANRLLNINENYELQGQISMVLQQLKLDEETPIYPFGLEQELLHCIETGDEKRSKELLNQLLGHLFFSSGCEFDVIKSRIYELLVLISRAAINGGADTQQSFLLNQQYLQQIQAISNVDDLCFWLSAVMERFVAGTFEYRKVKHLDIIRKAVAYLQRNYAQKITLEDVAKYVFLSPAYFSKVFKEEMGETYNAYLQRLRIEKSKMLLPDRSLKLVQIAIQSGFEDQSYFTKIFKKVEGVSPMEYRKRNKYTRI